MSFGKVWSHMQLQLLRCLDAARTTSGSRSCCFIACMWWKEIGICLFTIMALATSRKRMHDSSPTLFCLCGLISFPALGDPSKRSRTFCGQGCFPKVLDQACAKGCRSTIFTRTFSGGSRGCFHSVHICRFPVMCGVALPEASLVCFQWVSMRRRGLCYLLAFAFSFIPILLP